MKKYTLNLFSEQKEILEEFMEKYYNEKITFNTLKYEKVYENPIDMIELNLDKIIRYLLERYPY